MTVADSYLGWSDPRKTVTDAQRIADAVATYRERRGAEPGVVIVHPAALDGLQLPLECGGVTAHGSRSVARETVLVGAQLLPGTVVQA